MPKISDEKRAARRTQILEAAWSCFQAQGLHATTMDDIIKASGLSAGAVYSYFSGKDALILAAVKTSLGDLQALLEPLLREPPPSPGVFVERVAAAVARFSARDGYDLRRVALLGWSEAQRNAQLRETMRGFYLAFRDRLADAAALWKKAGALGADASARDVAKTLLSAILGFVVQSAIMDDVEPKDLARGLRDLGKGGNADAG
ncbi:TetR/AcrR family transcriptional regulator [Methylocella sp.]|uniref:TetR/AcrR family transcriptional regulator n=1 Tax=Methylocella sp. TaxID=1978226 RepID=UPI003783C17F